MSAEQLFKPSAQKLLQEDGVEIWNAREQEPEYAKLSLSKNKSPEVKAKNIYDQPIDLIELVNETIEREQSLYINGNPAVGENPNRNKQHSFYFTADNCIGCHACESACAEKNETPAHLSYRSVGYVEGGSYPDFQRMNISMACNHCDDPVCLKGCPTNAYTKHTEYGAVLQDPETCFGCGYCTWVCPYNAPQLDPVKGQVSKCNMCVDRLEVGLKPACVSACVGNALDFGVVENIPKNREQAKTAIPGFPDPNITHPNIRFQQKKGLPEEMTRTDSAPIKYRMDNESNSYKPMLDAKHGHKKEWNVQKLNSRENPLVLFTLATQAGIGAFLIPFLGSLLGFDAMQAFRASDWFIAMPVIGFALAAFGLLLSTTHLGKPMRFYRGFNNLRYSPVSREGFGVAVFMGFAAFCILCLAPGNTPINTTMNNIIGFDLSALDGWFTRGMATCFGLLACAGAAGGLFYMVKCYLIPARPFWNHWHTPCTFVGNALSLGAILSGSVALLANGSLSSFAWVMAAGITLELIGLKGHAKYNHAEANHEGAASHYVQTTEYGKTYFTRNLLLLIALGLSLLVATLLSAPASAAPVSTTTVTVWAVASTLLIAAALIGRSLFYILVIPTTMPGAFFWRNKGFEEHAKETGLADAIDLGVISDGH